MRVLLLGLLLGAGLGPAALAQGSAADPVLDVQAAMLTGEAEDGLFPDGTDGKLLVPWTLTFPTPASAAADLLGSEATVAIAGQCDGGVTIQGASSIVAFSPDAESYTGETIVTISTSAETVGLTEVTCQLVGTFTGTRSSVQDTVATGVPLVFVSALNVTVLDDHRKAGPQKIIRYALELHNGGGGRMQVMFDLPDGAPEGRWNVLLPAPVLLQPGANATAVVAVATPYENGKVDESIKIVVRVIPSSAETTQSGTPIDVPLHAAAEGLYIPGLSTPWLVAALAGLAAVAARRR